MVWRQRPCLSRTPSSGCRCICERETGETRSYSDFFVRLQVSLRVCVSPHLRQTCYIHIHTHTHTYTHTQRQTQRGKETRARIPCLVSPPPPGERSQAYDHSEEEMGNFVSLSLSYTHTHPLSHIHTCHLSGERSQAEDHCEEGLGGPRVERELRLPPH